MHSASASSILQCCCNIRLFIVTHKLSLFMEVTLLKRYSKRCIKLWTISIFNASSCWSEGEKAREIRPSGPAGSLLVGYSSSSKNSMVGGSSRPNQNPLCLILIPSFEVRDVLIWFTWQQGWGVYGSSSLKSWLCLHGLQQHETWAHTGERADRKVCWRHCCHSGKLSHITSRDRVATACN